MSEHGRVWPDLTDVTLNKFQELMATLDGPGAGDQDMDRYKPADARPAGAQGVELNALLFVWCEDTSHELLFLRRQGPVHQAGDRAPDNAAARPNDVGGHAECDDGVEALPTGEGSCAHAAHDAD